MDGPIFYTLDENHNPIPTYSVFVWGRWFENIENRRVAHDVIGKYRVSTVCLGLDHSFSFEDEKPIIFETMAFDETSEHPFRNVYMNRCATWNEAVEMHAKAVSLAKIGFPDENNPN